MLLHALNSQTLRGLSVETLAGFLLALVHFGSVPTEIIISWLSLLLVANLWRGALSRNADWFSDEVVSGKTARWIDFSHGAAGMVWGAASILFIPILSPIDGIGTFDSVKVYMTLAIFGLVIGNAIWMVSPTLFAQRTFIFLSIGPAMIGFGVSAAKNGQTMAALLFALLVYSVWVGRSYRQTLTEAHGIKRRDQKLMDRIAQENDRTDLLKTELSRSHTGLRETRDSVRDMVESRTAHLTSAVSRLEQEIRDRQTTEAALMEEKAKFEAWFDQAPEAMVLVDPERTILKTNSAITEIFEYAEGEIVGQKTAVLYDQNEDWERMAEERFAPGSLTDKTPYIVTMKRKHGDTFPCEVTRSVMRSPNGDLIGFIGSMRDISSRYETEAQIEFLAHNDALTKLPNRALFMDRLNMALAQAQRDEALIAVLLLDLDDFKQVNDTLGHEIGDALLVEVARRLRKCARSADTVARLGGDEFGIIQARTETVAETGMFAERLLEALVEPVVIDGEILPIGASIGATVFPNDAQDGAELLKNADLAMYRAKDEDRGNFTFYSLEMGSEAAQRMVLAGGLRRALADDQFVLHYQPKVDAQTGILVGCEALLRWMHPDEGLMSPGKFIPVAESTGLILPIGAWVLEEGCRQLRGWMDQGRKPVPLSVNLSAAQFRDPRLVERVRNALHDSDIEPALLELEITETALMHNTEDAIRVLTALTELGVMLSIDDFGTGYSSLNYLKRFPVGRLKIDQSFVHGIVESTEDAAIARAVTELGHSLGLAVLAEGVETEAQNDALKLLGCDEIQGFLTGRPINPDAFSAILNDQ